MGFVIGTAGHVDHGKTALVRALTGQDTDRLQAEKDRGISIDLGFAYFNSPGGARISIVDVPGHEKFIRNMAAGAHGIDLVLFVVAADDGVMPQTEEHFDILCSMGVTSAIFVISKTDVADSPRLSDVADEITILVDGSTFEGSPVVPVSNISGTGIDTLISMIDHALVSAPAHTTSGHFRMPIDRVFTIHGRGVVVTGTPVSGAVAIGDEIAIAPGGDTFRVRGLQSHGDELDQGKAGARLAINLAGAKRSAIQRGDVAAAPMIARVTDRIDVALSVAPHANAELRTGQRVRLHLGTAERTGTVILFGGHRTIPKGGEGLAQIKLFSPAHAMAGDHFVMRDEQAEHTLGGGTILDPAGERAHRKHKNHSDRLLALHQGDPIHAIEMLIEGSGEMGVLEADMVFRLNMPLDQALRGITDSETLIRLGGPNFWITSKARILALHQMITTTLSTFHQSQPSTPGLGWETLHSQIAPASDLGLFREIVGNAVSSGILTRTEALLALPSHQAGLSENQQAQAALFLATREAEPFSPPAHDSKDADLKVIITHLERQGKVKTVAKEVVFASAAYAAAEQHLEDTFQQQDTITAAQFRDKLGTTRKYALALLEHFDRTGHTIRIGDSRKQGKPKGRGNR